MSSLPRNTILLGDARQRLEQLPRASIDCVITSPPYYQLRDYGVAGQIGLEATVSGWVRSMREVFRGVARVLKPAGSVWLDLGDSYSRHRSYGAVPKSLLLAPERLLLALAGDGWIVRNKVIWAKANPMPTSVADRLNTTYEVVYFLVRSPRYFFDLHAIREPHRSQGGRSGKSSTAQPKWAGPLASTRKGLSGPRQGPGHPLGKNPGDVWRISTAGFRGPHFAAFPPKLVERPLVATCPARVCSRCETPWRTNAVMRERPRLAPGCTCAAETVPGVVLDPFFGTGTVGAVAKALGRDWLGVELNPNFVELAKQRLGTTTNNLTLEAAA